MSFKICPTCKTNKPHSDYGKHNGRKFNLADYCKVCRNKRAILRRFKITEQDKQNMLDVQEYKCSICKVHQNDLKTILAIDHCHKTNKIRGLLCQFCNIGIGHFRDNVSFLESAIIYLQKSKK